MPRDAVAFLGEVLSRNGSLALPYDEEVKELVRAHLLELIKDLPSLSVRLRSYTHLDGSSVQLLLADGTVPMFYQNTKYNIPVAFWLPEGYPVQPPIAYVVPTSDMIITPHHPYVDASGLVSSPYMARWQFPESNLCELAQDMSMLFADRPPLFAKPAGWLASIEQPASVEHTPLQDSRPPQDEAACRGEGTSVHVHNPMMNRQEPHVMPRPGRSAEPVRHATHEPPPSWLSGGSVAGVSTSAVPHDVPRRGARPSTAEALKGACHNTALEMLIKRVQSSLESEALPISIAGRGEVNQQLSERNALLSHEVAALQSQRLAYDTLAHELVTTVGRLESWLSMNEFKAKHDDQPGDAGSLITAMDSLSAQALAVQAEDLAIEDCLYALDKALNAGMLSSAAYLKQVRALCTRQLLVRVLSNKIARQQNLRSAEVGDGELPTAGQGSSGVQMAVGDTWYSTGVLRNPLATD